MATEGLTERVDGERLPPWRRSRRSTRSLTTSTNEDVVVIILDTKEGSEAIAEELQRRGRRVHVESAPEFICS
jgi:hypothetical protein